MRRGLSIFAVLFVLLVAACAAGWFALRMAPEQLRRQTERLIAEATGAEVKLGELHLALRLFPWLRLEARGDRVDVSAPSARVAVDSISTSLDPLALLRGQVKPHHVRLSRVRADFAGTGALWAARDEAPDAPGAAQAPSPARLLAALESAATTLRDRPGAEDSPGLLAGVALEVAELSIWLERGAAQPALPLLREGAARLSFSADSRRSDFRLTGQIATGAAGSIEEAAGEAREANAEGSAKIAGATNAVNDASAEGATGAAREANAEGGAKIAGAAEILGGARAAGTALRFEMHAERSEVGARLSLGESDLGALFDLVGNAGAFNAGAGVLAERIRAALPLRGRAGLALGWRAPRLGPQRFELSLDGRGLQGRIGAAGALQALIGNGAGKSGGASATNGGANATDGRVTATNGGADATEAGAAGGKEAAPWLALNLRRPHLRLDLAVAEDALELHAAELTDGALALRAEGRAALPFAGAASLQASLSADRLSRAALAHAAAQLGGELRKRAEAALAGMDSGELRRLRIELQSSAAGLGEIAARGPLARPGELHLSLRFANLALRGGGGANDGGADGGGAVRSAGGGVSGALRFDGDRLEIRGLTLPAQPQAKSFRIDAELSGLSGLRAFSQLRCLRPAPVPALPGIGPLRAWQWSRRPDPYVPRWQNLHLELDWFAHPVFFCAGRNIAFTMKPVPARARIEFAVESGLWAGLPIEASGHYREDKTQRRMQISAVLHARGATAAAAAQGGGSALAQALAGGGPWARGRFELRAERMGIWRISGARGTARAHGSTLHLGQMQVELDPGGPVDMHIAIVLGEARLPRYRAALALAGADLLDLWTAAGLERGLLSGSLHGALTLQGRLVLGQNVLYGANGTASLQARAGEIHRRIPLLLAIAGHRFNPFGNRERLPYRAVDLVGLLRGGDLQIHVLSLAGPNLRAAVQGHAQLAPPWQIEGVLGLFFFPLLDNLIELIPLLNRVILGKNGNLVGAYFALDGTLPAPRARLVPGRSLIEGPAGSVLFSIPNFVFDGIRGIQSIVQPRSRANGGGAPPGAGREES